MTRRCSEMVGLLVVLGTAFSIAVAQEATTGIGVFNVEAFLSVDAERLSNNFLDGATSLDAWRTIRPRLHQEFLYALGLSPMPPKTPLEVHFTGDTVEHEGVFIDKLHFQSQPGLYVTANLYRPQGTTRDPEASETKYPCVLYVCGHSGRGRDGNKTAFQDHGIWFANHGYICLMVDTLQLGEIPGVHHGTYGRPWNHLGAYGIDDKEKQQEGVRWWWHARGYTPAGVECWNGIRGIDYLVSRADVDAGKLAVTGISGGGAATIWIAAADERVTCAVPVSGMSDLRSYVTDRVINGHCDCMFMYNTYGWDWATIAAFIAPRPLLFANSDNDALFPMDGNRRLMQKLRDVYTMHGKPELVHEYVSQGGHDYRPDLRLAVFRWINEHLKRDVQPIEDSSKYAVLPGETLRVFPTIEGLPEDHRNGNIDETFVPRASVPLPERGGFDVWKQHHLANLREHCFRNLPATIPAATQQEPRPFAFITAMATEPGVTIFGAQASMPRSAGEAQTLLVFTPLDTQDLASRLYPQSLQPYSQGGMVVWPRFGWPKQSPPNYVERAHVLVGRTVDEGRLRDILATWRLAREKHVNVTRIAGEGVDGILAAYAAILEPEIQEVVIVDPPTSHEQGPYFLNVMRVLDIPDALGMLAPRKLTLINAADPAFDRTAQLYRIAGAEESLIRN